MRKIYKLGLSLGATASIVAPITTMIACSSDNKIHKFDTNKTATKIMMQDLSKIDAITPYSTATLNAEAKKIGGEVIWRGSLQQEAISQGLNLLYQLAERLGFDFNEQLERNNTQVITDEMASKSDAELLASLKIAPGTGEAETALHLKNIKLDTRPITKEMSKYTFRMSPGNQTIDGDGDFKQMHMTSLEQTQFNETNQGFDDKKDNLKGKYLINTWNDGKDINVAFGEKGGSIIRRIVNSDAAQSYPSIKDETDFAENYAPFVSGLLQKFIGSLGDTPIDISMIVGTPLSMVVAFLIDQFSTTSTDDTGTTTKLIDFSNPETKQKFAQSISEVNKTGNVNWLAVKAFYLGFDKSFTENQYENWTVTPTRDDWKQNESFKGIKEFSSWTDLMTIGVWQHGASASIFNPSLSVEDNIKLNDQFKSFN